MAELGCVLVVDDSAINRKILCKILSDNYLTVEAENGKDAIEKLHQNPGNIVAILLDIVMPVMDGYEFLKAQSKDELIANIPVLVTTGNTDNENEIKALEHGACDFVSKPYNADIIKFRLKNVITRSQLAAFKQLKYLAEYDTLTGIYNKKKFFDKTHEMLVKNPDKSFVFIRFDVDRFQLINSFYGMDEGDRLLKYIAKSLEAFIADKTYFTYGRIEADVFSLCMLYDKKTAINEIARARNILTSYNLNFDIVPSFGVYIIDNNEESVNTMYDKASLASRSCKESYTNFYATYTANMSEDIVREQEIVNEMKSALANKEFMVYLQPKYNLQNNHIAGAEALVRWKHPKKGMISPGVFIPVFERNGFISNLDFYMWDKICQLLHKWMSEGKEPYPISVNVSRVNLYNPKLVQVLENLVKKYNIPPELFNLELTESAYTDNPEAMRETMAKLKSNGFIIMMDDFGSGYSSLNILKDIEVDVLKIDMRFLAKTRIPGRGENIIASVIRMAKWLNIPVIAEGAETKEQVDFLHSVGCEFVQGYYFAKPMPVEDYEFLMNETPVFKEKTIEKDDFNADDLWVTNPQMELLFSNVLQAVAIYEFDPQKGNIEIMRVNNAFYDLFGYADQAIKCEAPIAQLIAKENQNDVLQAFYEAVASKDTATCEYLRYCANDTSKWINVKLKYINAMGDKYVLFGALTDITSQKEIDNELQKYRAAISSSQSQSNTMLIVDDFEVNRVVLKEIFNDKYNIIEASNGIEALEEIKKVHNDVDIILLDLMMPQMDGKAFLQQKQSQLEIANIPVVIITADDSPEQQIKTLSLGANDYIVKPFVPEIVLRRVDNVLELSRRYNDMLREYNSVVKQAKIDPLTGIYNRNTAEELINNIIKIPNHYLHAILMIDIDNFKQINDNNGHEFGDEVLKEFAGFLTEFFDEDDIVCRIGGDEFLVFDTNIGSKTSAMQRYDRFCEKANHLVVQEAEVHCSFGVSIAPNEGKDFAELYRNADKALYMAKREGKNRYRFYHKENIE